MPALPNPPVITANGSYEVPVSTGQQYLFTLKGAFGGGTVTLSTRSNANNGTFDSVEGGAFTAPTEQTFIAPSGELRLTLSGASSSTITVTLTPLL